ncbi:hypothetical protein CVT26_015814 [Gymnopilus dilepis]|uniref:Uncharacterized protein n=1 Tax=Gymnopilus dilepis TaxID=231916 RepID=A0A409WHR4_9AGAR|nr:hypothetical protein CVT26_015814 [Gymnopilus dilepis]
MQVKSSPTSSSASLVLRGTPYLVTILVLISSLALLFTVKYVFVSHRRRRRNIFTAGLRVGSPCAWRDDLSIPSINLHQDAPNTTKKEPKSAFLVGLLGSPSWETRPLAKLDFSFNFSDTSIPDRAHSLDVRRVHSIRDRGVCGLLLRNTSTWCPLECPKDDRWLMLTGRKLMATSRAILRGKRIFGKPQKSTSSDLPMSYYTQKEALDLSKSCQSSPSLDAQSSSLTVPAPALIYPWRSLSLSPTYVDAQAVPHAHLDGEMCALPSNSHKYGEKTTEGPSSRHSGSITSSISLPVIPSELERRHQTLSNEHMRFGISAHPYASPATYSSTLPPRQKICSPTLRPSPLRNMYLPLVDNHSECLEYLTDDEYSIGHQVNEVEEEDDRHHLLASLSPRSLLDCKLQDPEIFRQPKTKDQADNLVTFLEELVQATSGWDDSLFLDSNFRAMINSSKPADSPTMGSRTRAYTPRRRLRASFISLEDIPEVDGESTVVGCGQNGLIFPGTGIVMENESPLAGNDTAESTMHSD